MKLEKYSCLFLYGLIILGIHLPLGLFAQPLDSLLDRARKQNLSLRALHHDYQASLKKAPQARLIPGTELGLGGFVLPVQTRVGPQRMRLGVMQKLPWFGTLDAREQLSLSAAKPLANQVEIEALNIFYKIKLAYYRVYEIQEIRKILGRNIILLERLRRLSLIKIEGGKASTVDVLRLEIKLREMRKQVQILDQQLLQPQSDINQLLNRELSTEISIEEELDFAAFLNKQDSLFSEKIEQHPSVNYLNNRQKLAKSAIALSEKQGKPSFGFGADYLWVEGIPSANLVGNGRDILQIKASLNIPLQRKPYLAKREEELLKIDALEHRKEALEDQFLASIRKSKAIYEEARLRHELYLEQVEYTRSVIQILQSEYSNNGNGFDELINLEMDLLSYEKELVNSIVQSHRAKAAIERIIY